MATEVLSAVQKYITSINSSGGHIVQGVNGDVYIGKLIDTVNVYTNFMLIYIQC